MHQLAARLGSVSSRHKAGADAVEAIGSRTETRRRVVGADQAAGPLQQHTLAVNDVGICFVRAAREQGDECGPWAWRHEIAHPIGHAPGQRQGEHVIADALLTYQRTTAQQTSFHYRLIELDRATMPTDDLAAKLARDGRLYHYTLPGADGLDDPAPLWTQRYSVSRRSWWCSLVAIGAASNVGDTRCVRSAARTKSCKDVPGVRVDICLLRDLQRDGPRAPIFRSADCPERPIDWLGGEAA